MDTIIGLIVLVLYGFLGYWFYKMYRFMEQILEILKKKDDKKADDNSVA